MQIVSTKADMRRLRRDLRGPVAFVPTMGALHDGHLVLVDAARARAAMVVMSVFVNPLQFAPTDDFSAYPRDLDRDAALARARGVDVLFAPTVAEMYPTPSRVLVTPVRAGERPALDSRWEGASRPGHFAGVLTVVAKLFHIVGPDMAMFGRKDFQQVTLIRAMVQDLDLGVEIVTVPTVRAADGLALSSRNAYLSAAERAQALVIPQSLQAIQRAWGNDRIDDADALLTVGRRVLEREPGVVGDYLALTDPTALEPVRRAEAGAVVMIAARVGRTRLIDNIVLEPQGLSSGEPRVAAPPSEPRPSV
jgi:pantoate--beta-alanine ligase